MSPVDKEICLKILKRGLRPKAWTPFPGDKMVHNGSAGSWKEANDPQYQKLLQEAGLSMDTHVAIWDQGSYPEGGRNYCIVY